MALILFDVIAEAVSALLCASGFAITGFGFGVIFHIIMQLFYSFHPSGGDLLKTVVSLQVLVFFILYPQLVHLRKYVNKPMLCVMLVPWLSGLYAGTELLVLATSSPWMKRVLGLIFLLIGARQIFLDIYGGSKTIITRSFDMKPLKHKIIVVCYSLAAGLLGGMFGTPGPPWMVFVVWSNIDTTEWKATFTAINCVIIPIQATLLLIVKQQFQLDQWPRYAINGFCGISALALGNKLSAHINIRTVRRAIILLLVSGALLMMTTGVAGAAVPVVATVAGGCLLLFIVARCRKLRGGGEEEEEYAAAAAEEKGVELSEVRVRTATLAEEEEGEGEEPAKGDANGAGTQEEDTLIICTTPMASRMKAATSVTEEDGGAPQPTTSEAKAGQGSGEPVAASDECDE